MKIGKKNLLCKDGENNCYNSVDSCWQKEDYSPSKRKKYFNAIFEKKISFFIFK